MAATRLDPAAGGTLASGAEAAELIARLEAVPFSKWHIWPRVIMGSATFFDAFTALSLAFAMPLLATEWHLTNVEIGLLLGPASYLGQLAGALLFATLGERHGRVKAATAATVVMALGSLACAFTGNFTELFLCRFIQGIGVGGEMPVAATYINELSRAHGRGRFFMLYELIFPLGFLAAGLLGARLVPVYGWNALFVVGVLPGLIISLLVYRLPESPRWLIGKGRMAEAEAIVRQVEASTDKRAPRTAIAVPLVGQAKKSRWGELFSPVYRHRTLIVWVIWATAYGVTNGLNNWMPRLYRDVYHLPLQTALNTALLTNLTQVGVLIVCIFVIDRLGRRAWMTGAFVVGGLLLAALGIIGGADVMPVMVLVTLSYGVMSTVNTVLYLYTPEIYPTRMRALGTAAGTCWLRLASAAGPAVVGFMMGATGIEAIFLMFAGFAMVGALAAWQAIETRNRPLEEIAP
jgi:putative MFS transporter